jgi:hypothetical protein
MSAICPVSRQFRTRENRSPAVESTWRVKPWNDCAWEKLTGRGESPYAHFSSISAGPTSRPATEMEPVARRTFGESSASSLQQIDHTENKPPTPKRLVVSHRTRVRQRACCSNPAAPCCNSCGFRKSGLSRLNDVVAWSGNGNGCC